jgi:hypothetical protein
VPLDFEGFKSREHRAIIADGRGRTASILNIIASACTERLRDATVSSYCTRSSTLDKPPLFWTSSALVLYFFVVAVVVLQRCWRCGTSLHDALTRKRWTEIGRAPSYHMRFELIPTSFSRHPRILVREIPPWYFPSWQCTSFSAAFIFPELNSDDDDKQYMISHSSVYHQ